ncbi:MAG: hypothetical protein PHT44_04635 [Candidatus Portnoybacteria bacterium]|nr:hypothetical protein [Candidatus Portnoybacteria bacterium]MDD4983204.1 hypothetical protein [Candidatus Portnoybacteria bacterium]
MTKIPEKIKSLGKIIWWFIGAFLLIFGAFVGYQGYFGSRPNISSQIINETNVLDIHKSLKDLQIIFQGDNIQEKNQNLRIYRIKIENNGGTNITQNDFDQNDNWGIMIEKGRIIESRLADFASPYINDNLSPQLQDGSVVKFNKIIFDKGNFFSIELLVLHEKNTPPILYRTGKISGIQNNKSEISTVINGEPFGATFFYGSWFINIYRFIIFFIISFIIIIIVLYFIAKWQDKKNKLIQNPQQPQQPV